MLQRSTFLLSFCHLIYLFQCSLPFDLGPRRRARTYSFSGSERSHTATPTPSEVEGAMTEDESQTATEPANDLSHTEVFIVDLHILYCLPSYFID